MRSTRPATRALAVLTLTASGLLAPTAGHGATAYAAAPLGVVAAEETTEPLPVTMTVLRPAAIPDRGALMISGVVENGSAEEWTDINVAPFVSSEPITTRDELALAAASAPDATVGNRLTAPDVQASVGDLQPGEQAGFTVRVPVDDMPISGSPGAYWIGVHALGATEEGRDLVADGRARTFIPLVPREVARRKSVPVSVVLPLRERARRAADGSLNGPTRWVKLTGPEGRLARLADFGLSAGAAPLTWLVDPAVLDALQDFGLGNPPLSLGSARPRDAEGEVEPDSSPVPSPSPTPLAGTPTEEAQARANAVLERFLSTVRTDTALTLAYANPDVASLARRGPRLLRRANGLASQRMEAHSLAGSPVVAPPQGVFDPDLLGRVPPEALILLSDHGELEEPPLSRLPTGQDLVLSDQRAVTGGPAPNSPRSPLALRQRILAEASLEATKGDAPPRPLVVSFPTRWHPGTYWREADFFGGLELPWVRLAPLPRAATTAYDGELPYGRAERADEVPASNVAATRRLMRTSAVLGHLLANDNDVTARLDGAALQASAYSVKPKPEVAADQVLALDATTRAQMAGVEVTGTDFVTLSGGSGSLTITLVNGLEQPITVGLRARTDSPDVDVQIPEPVQMQAGERTTLRLQVRSGVGVHDVTLSPVTIEDEPVGTPLTFSLRTSQVGRLIWIIIIAGGVLLAVMIVRRIVLRIRHNRWRVNQE